MDLNHLVVVLISCSRVTALSWSFLFHLRPFLLFFFLFFLFFLQTFCFILLLYFSFILFSFFSLFYLLLFVFFTFLFFTYFFCIFLSVQTLVKDEKRLHSTPHNAHLTMYNQTMQIKKPKRNVFVDIMNDRLGYVYTSITVLHKYLCYL